MELLKKAEFFTQAYLKQDLSVFGDVPPLPMDIIDKEGLRILYIHCLKRALVFFKSKQSSGAGSTLDVYHSILKIRLASIDLNLDPKTEAGWVKLRTICSSMIDTSKSYVIPQAAQTSSATLTTSNKKDVGNSIAPNKMPSSKATIPTKRKLLTMKNPNPMNPTNLTKRTKTTK